MRLNRRASRWIGCLVVGVGVAAGAAAQPPAPDDERPTFRSGTTLIRTDVIVRDATSAFIPDLTPDDFVVEMDGVRQEVASLVLVHGGRVFNRLLPPPPVREGIIVPPTRQTEQVAGRIIILFVDELHLEPNSTPMVRHFVKDVGEALIHEGDLFGLVTNGPSNTVVDLTYDRSRLEEAADAIVGHGFGPRELIEEIQEGRDGPTELRWRAHRAFKTAYDVVEALEAIPNRRKAFIYISTGYDLNPFPLQRLYRMNVPTERLRDRGGRAAVGGEDGTRVENPIVRVERQGAVFADGELIGELDELTQAANRANTTFYTMDPRGLISAPDIDYNVPIDEWGEYLRTARSSLRTLADLTGGLSIVNTNNFDEMLQRIDAETSDYYILGFYASDSEPSTERIRALNVVVDREGAVVQSRTSYRGASESQ